MHILLTDETNRQPSRDVRFFVYGGLLFNADVIGQIDERMADIRRTAGYRRSDEFKFDTRSRPDHVTIDAATNAKRQAVQLAADSGCKFIVHVILHDIIAQQDPDQQLLWAV